MESSDLSSVLAAQWGLSPPRLRQLTGGMNSRVWEIGLAGPHYVAKVVAHEQRRALCAGLVAADVVDKAGIPAGAPRPTRSGELVVRVEDGWLAVLSWVDGVPLQGDEDDQLVIGRVLGAAHASLHGVASPEAPQFHWIDIEARHLDIEDWVRPAVQSAVRSWEVVADEVTSWGLLHGDPAPDAFLRPVGHRTCGLIDWSSAFYGPLLYDVASAVMYVGGIEKAAALISAYLEHGTVSPHEVAVGLRPLLRFRWAVQADYFARRLAAGDLTGITGSSENVKGLEDARRQLQGG